jgi:glycerol-3-phosphate dehydrogenase subunit C
VSVESTLDRCIKCNICVAVCPVSAVTDLFPGPKYEGPQAARFRSRGGVADRSVDYCSGCRVCNLACPTGVRIAEINARARARMVEAGRFGLRTRIRNNLIARPDLLGRLGRPAAPLVNAAFAARPARLLAEWMLGIDHRAPLPTISRSGFRAWFRRQTTRDGPRGTVAYFHGCSTERFEPRVGRAAVAVLQALGYRVLVPRQSCCGLPLLSNGEFAAARRLHRKNVAALVGFASAGIPIVGTSTSCTLTLKEEAPELLDAHDEASRTVAAAVYDLAEFLSGVDLGNLEPVNRRILYHPPCQYRAHRVGTPSLDLLKRIPGLEVVESKAACCGVAGTYGYKKEKYEIAMKVGDPLFRQVRESRVGTAVCDSETCRWQITHGTGVDSIHPIELLAEALGVGR